MRSIFTQDFALTRNKMDLILTQGFGLKKQKIIICILLESNWYQESENNYQRILIF